MSYKRRVSSIAHVGQLGIGGDNPIRIQSMATKDTNDTEGCVAQAKRTKCFAKEQTKLSLPLMR